MKFKSNLNKASPFEAVIIYIILLLKMKNCIGANSIYLTYKEVFLT